MTEIKAGAPEIAALLRQAEAARQAGQPAEASGLFARIVASDPQHAAAWNALGLLALGDDAPLAAATHFARAAAADPGAAPLWMNLAKAQRLADDSSGERAALERALALDQRHLMANVRIAELHERLGESNAAAFRWGGVASMIEAMPDASEAMVDLLAHARGRVAVVAARMGAQIDTGLVEARRQLSTHARRFDACVDAMLGRRRVFHNEPHGLHFPFLPADEFFERRHFPWMDELEAAAPAIRSELHALLTAPDNGFAPYVDQAPGTPTNKWTPLDGSRAWSARYLWRYGERQAEVCARCPATSAALDRVPLAAMPGKGPTAFFSILQPGARLPGHTGVSNVRAVVHLPLIVPPGCGFRVGGETREWVEGEAFAFDDTIEHEAWNDSDAVRAVLILDVWNPHLTAAERDGLRALFRTLGQLDDVPDAMGAVTD